MSRRDSNASLLEMLALPSVPLKPAGDPGPPRIIECQDNYNAIEGSVPIKDVKENRCQGSFHVVSGNNLGTFLEFWIGFG